MACALVDRTGMQLSLKTDGSELLDAKCDGSFIGAGNDRRSVILDNHVNPPLVKWKDRRLLVDPKFPFPHALVWD
jgi:hypothetical protein